MATTTKGIVYPTSSDNIAPLETHFANLANSVDTALGSVSASIPTTVVNGTQSFTGPATAAASVTVTVTFNSALTSVPTVVATVQGTGSVTPHIVTLAGSPTMTGFTATVYKVSGSTADELILNWMARV